MSKTARRHAYCEVVADHSDDELVASFTRPQVIDPGLPAQSAQEPASRPLVAFAADGTATVAWTRSRQTRTQPPRTAFAAPGQRFTRRETVARVAALGGLALAVRPDGTAVLAWRADRRGRNWSTGPVLVARRDPSSPSFQRPETVARAGATMVSAVGFSPGDGSPIVVWGARHAEMPAQTTDVRVQVRRP